MPREPSAASDAQDWLVKAGSDLRAAGVDLAADPPLIADSLFHCQQAVEKALKAFLTWHDRRFRKTHDLGELGQQCAAIDRALEPLCRRAESLTVYAWLFRYPGEADEPPAAEAAAALTLAAEVCQAIRASLPEEGGR